MGSLVLVLSPCSERGRRRAWRFQRKGEGRRREGRDKVDYDTGGLGKDGQDDWDSPRHRSFERFLTTRIQRHRSRTGTIWHTTPSMTPLRVVCPTPTLVADHIHPPFRQSSVLTPCKVTSFRPHKTRPSRHGRHLALNSAFSQSRQQRKFS